MQEQNTTQNETNTRKEHEAFDMEKYKVAREWVWGIALVGYVLYFVFTELM